jgi:hypothetical protein
MPTYRLHRVRKRLEQLGAVNEPRGGRKHATIRIGSRVARWPNPCDDPLDEGLLSAILRQLGVSRDEFFGR